MEEQSFEQIEAYLLGKLDGDELSAFQKKQAEDPAFAKTVAQEQALFNGLKVYGNKVLKDRIGDIRSKMFQEEEVKYRKLEPRKWYRYAAAIAAVLVVGMFAYWQMQPAINGNQIFADHFEPVYDLPIASRSGEDSINNEIATIRKLYAENNFQELIPKVKAFHEQFPSERYAHLMLIIAYIGEDRLAEAKAELDQFEPSNDLSDANNWYRALICVKEKNFDKARILLQSIEENSSSNLHQRAIDLLDAIE